MQLHYNLLFRWYVDLSPADRSWHPTTFTKNRDQLLNEKVMGKLLEKQMGAPEDKPLLCDEHYSADGTLLQAWASRASLEWFDGQGDSSRPLQSGPGEVFSDPKSCEKRAKGDFRGIKLSTESHRSGTDTEALLCRKSKADPALLSYRGHVLMDKLHALIVDCHVTQATDTRERDTAKAMASDHLRACKKTIGPVKNYYTKGLSQRWAASASHHTWLRSLLALVAPPSIA